MINLELIKKIYSINSYFRMPASPHSLSDILNINYTDMEDFYRNFDTPTLKKDKKNADDDFKQTCGLLVSNMNYYKQQPTKLKKIMSQLECLERMIAILSRIINER